MPITLDGTLGITTTALTVTGATVNTGGISTAGNLTFTSTGQRITGDFSNATVANRVAFQSSTTNGNTSIPFIPNGSAAVSGALLYGGSDTANANLLQVLSSGAINATITGTGAYQPLTMSTGGSERLRIDTSGNVGIGTSSPDGRLQIQTDTNKSAVFVNAVHNTLTNLGTAIRFSRASDGVSGLSAIASWNNGGIAFAGREGLVFATGGPALYNETVERMRIDSAGNVMIGTTSAVGKVSINSGTTTDGGSPVFAQSIRAGTITYLDIYQGYNSTIAGKSILGTTLVASDALAFATSATERMRIDSSGQISIGTTNASAAAGAGVKFIPGANSYVATVVTDSTNTYASYYMYSLNAAAYRFYVGAGGTVYATSTTISALSDERLKENVRDLETGLSEILAIKPRKFDWKEGKGQDKKNAVGFIAQEFETVFPNSVDTSIAGGDGIEYKTVCHEELIPTLVKAIQELNAKLEAQALEIVTLKG